MLTPPAAATTPGRLGAIRSCRHRGIGIGLVFGHSIEAMARQPEAMPIIRTNMFLGFLKVCRLVVPLIFQS